MVAVVTQRENWGFLALPGTVVLLVLASWWFGFAYGYVEDDAYIHLEFARSLANHQGYAFNGVVTNGDTAPLWPLLIAGIHSLGLGWVASAKWVCTAGLAGALAGCWVLVRDLAVWRVEQPLLPLAAVVVTAVNPFFVHWSFSGMESVTALGVSFWAIWLVFLGHPSLSRALVAALLLAVGPLLRPELLLLCVIAGPALLLRSWAALASRSLTHRIAMFVGLGALMALPLAIWSGYALEAFGSIVPNTNGAKRGGPISELAPRLVSVYALGFPVTLAALPFVLPRLARGHIPAALWVLLIWPVGCLLFYLFNHTLVQTRYCLLSMPSLSIAVLWLIADAYRPRMFAAVAGAMLAAGAVSIGLIVAPHVANKERYSEALSQMAAYLRREVPAGDPVAVFAIGQIAFQSQHPLVDIGGITDPSVIPFMGNPEATLKWARAHGARYYITGIKPEPQAVRVFTTPAPFIGWTLRHSRYSTQQQLELYRLP